MVNLRVARPLYAFIALLKVLAALLVEFGLNSVLAVLQEEIVQILLGLHAHVRLADVAHEYLERGAVEKRVMNVKEYIAALLCFEYAAAVQTAADHLERLNEVVL